MNLWKYYKIGKDAIDKARRRLMEDTCGNCPFQSKCWCEIFNQGRASHFRCEKCRKEIIED